MLVLIRLEHLVNIMKELEIEVTAKNMSFVSNGLEVIDWCGFKFPAVPLLFIMVEFSKEALNKIESSTKQNQCILDSC